MSVLPPCVVDVDLRNVSTSTTFEQSAWTCPKWDWYTHPGGQVDCLKDLDLYTGLGGGKQTPKDSTLCEWKTAVTQGNEESDVDKEDDDWKVNPSCTLIL